MIFTFFLCCQKNAAIVTLTLSLCYEASSKQEFGHSVDSQTIFLKLWQPKHILFQLFDIGVDGGEQETDGEMLAETEEVPYECGPRQKYPMLFEEPVPLQVSDSFNYIAG